MEGFQEKANLFANHLSNVFKSHSSKIAAEITEHLHSPFQMSPPIEPFTSVEVTKLIRRLNPRKASGHYNLCKPVTLTRPINQKFIFMVDPCPGLLSIRCRWLQCLRKLKRPDVEFS